MSIYWVIVDPVRMSYVSEFSTDPTIQIASIARKISKDGQVRCDTTSHTDWTHRDKLQSVTLQDLQEELVMMPKDEEGREVFQKFLTSEWSVENLLFYQAVNTFRENFDRLQDQLNVSNSIYRNYFDLNGPLCINLPHNIGEDVKNKLMTASPQVSPSLYDAAFDEIMSLMVKDSFRRFIIRENTKYEKFCDA